MNRMPLEPVDVQVGGRALSLLVRPGTLDERVVREVVATYRIEALVARLAPRPRVTIFDIGGHIGSFSIIMATLLPQARIHLFEPVPANFEMVLCNIEHAGVEQAITPHGAGVSGRQGFIALDDIALSPDRRNTGGHAVLGPQISAAAPEGRAFVELLPLGALLDREAHVDLLKIDCEGAEFDILYSLTAAQLAKVEAIVGELHHCFGFAGTTTAGLEWTAPVLKAFLGRHYRTLETDHRIETDSAVLETFYADDPKRPGPPTAPRPGSDV